jgi:hypothetical protein
MAEPPHRHWAGRPGHLDRADTRSPCARARDARTVAGANQPAHAVGSHHVAVRARAWLKAWALKLWWKAFAYLYLFPGLMVWSLFRWPKALSKIREKGGEDAVELARFVHMAIVWAILMLGSGLILIAAILTRVSDV